ncbi:unnamed protein product, partial [Ceratitis capitata]
MLDTVGHEKHEQQQQQYQQYKLVGEVAVWQDGSISIREHCGGDSTQNNDAAS